MGAEQIFKAANSNQAAIKASAAQQSEPSGEGGTRAPFSMRSHELLLDYFQKRTNYGSHTFNMRARMEFIDRVYQRELDYTQAQIRARAANAAGDSSKMQNTTIPVVMPQVEALVNKLSEIFLSSYPIFPVVSKPKMIDAALQLETVIGNQSLSFGWSVELMNVMRDALKYNFCAAEVDWESQHTHKIVNNPGADVSRGTPAPTTLEGNFIRRRDPYNVHCDTRVPPYEVHTRGEFAGYTELISMIEMKMRLANLEPAFCANFKLALESGEATSSTASQTARYYVPSVNPHALLQPEDTTGTNWDRWAALDANERIKYAGRYEWSVLYCRLVPEMFKLAGADGNRVAIYKMIVINNKYIVYLKRMTNAHNYLPMIIAQSHEDGTFWQAKSFADTAAPYQALATALWNSGLESQRRKVYDRLLYDPSRIAKADIDKTSPVARIPVKAEHYGKPLGEAVYQFPYRDENVPQIFNSAQQVVEMADIANGQNRVQRGQFQKGNKTRHEYEDTMDNSDSRPRMTAMVLEFRLFQPIKTIVKTNTLQFQKAGDLFSHAKKGLVEIDPVKMREAALEFKLADGLMPSNSFINLQLFEKLLAMAGQNPMLASRYDLVGIVMYWLKLEGASWIDDFEIQPQVSQPGMPQPGMPPQLPPGLQ